ncbi:MAG: hypothetical protein GF333_03385 [Candidatus Omnitrophica bacterium]|nr:hypothetical protein [Candidatus Omnitrophota bacterium]
MKVLGICGTNKKEEKSASEWFLAEALRAAREAGADTESVRLSRYRLKPCLSCDLCFCGRKCPLFDDPEDDGGVLFEKFFSADALIFSSPVYSYQQPAQVINLIQRSRVFHEIARGRRMGLRSIKMNGNPYAGKPVGNLAVSATIGQETALAGILHNLRGLGAAPVACAGISLMEPVIKDMYRAADREALQNVAGTSPDGFEENGAARDMARAVGQYVCTVHASKMFQKIKHHIKL